jgi:hypothetical protein
VQLGWPLPLIVDAHSERAIEILSRIDNFLRNLAPDDSVLRRVSHIRLGVEGMGAVAWCADQAAFLKKKYPGISPDLIGK